jgi:hypothetical protein
MLIDSINKYNLAKENNDQVKYGVYNSWEGELLNDPFSSIYSSLTDIFMEADPSFASSENEKNLKNKATELLRCFLPFLLTMITGTPAFLGLGKAAESLSSSASTAIDKLLDSNKSKASVIKDFKLSLEECAKTFKTPIFIFIDELDRCSPKYVVSFLEVIKHFFNIPNITYVLCIDKSQILSSIEHEYGNIDSVGYLRKIITFQFNLPPIMNLNIFSSNYAAAVCPGIEKYFGEMRNFNLNNLFEAFSFTLRDIEKYITVMRLLNPAFQQYNRFAQPLLFIVALRMKYPEIYNSFLYERNIDQLIDLYNDNDILYKLGNKHPLIIANIILLSSQFKKTDKYIRMVSILKATPECSGINWDASIFSNYDFTLFIESISFDA